MIVLRLNQLGRAVICYAWLGHTRKKSFGHKIMATSCLTYNRRVGYCEAFNCNDIFSMSINLTSTRKPGTIRYSTILFLH